MLVRCEQRLLDNHANIIYFLTFNIGLFTSNTFNQGTHQSLCWCHRNIDSLTLELSDLEKVELRQHQCHSVIQSCPQFCFMGVGVMY